jgi:hypothetical protein
MTRKWYLLLLLLASLPLVFVSCDKDDDDDGDNDGVAPTMADMMLSADNLTATITFSEATYKNNDATGDLDESCFAVSIEGGSTTLEAFTVTHVAGEVTATITLDLMGAADGSEILKVGPAGADKIYDADGNAMDVAEMAEATLTDLGLIGSWKAYDISAILLGLGYDDSLYAHFNADQTYRVQAYIAGIEYELIGTYTQTKSDYGNIWSILLNQTEMNGTPTEITSEGIFEVYAASPDSMWYEVAQTNPAIQGVTAPTAEAGFGSTSGGLLGTANIQKYFRMED